MVRISRSSVKLIVLLALCVGGCRTIDYNYRPFNCTPMGVPWPFPGWHCKGGYSEVEIATDMYQVRFEGAATQPQTEDLTLLRCSELTLEKGYSHFVVVEAKDLSETKTGYSPGTYTPGTTVCDKEGKNCVTTLGTWSGGGSYTYGVPGFALTIQLVRDRPASGGPIAYDATSVYQDLRRKYRLSPVSGVAASPR